MRTKFDTEHLFSFPFCCKIEVGRRKRMKLVFTCKLEVEPIYHDVINEISLHMSKFYNMTLYEYKMDNYLTQNNYYELFKAHFRFGYLQSHTYIHAIKQAMKDMASFDALLKRYKKNTVKNQKPSLPRFKHEKLMMTPTFLKTAIRLREGSLLLSLGKKMKLSKQIKAINIKLPEKVYGLLKDKNIKLITLKLSDDGRYELKAVYEVEEKPQKEIGDIMSIDLGVSNLAAITFLNKSNQYLIDGNVIKSKLVGFNNALSESYSKEMTRTGSPYFKLTKKMRKQLAKRNGYVENYIHTASSKIVKLAIENDVKTIVIGDFKNIKRENKQKYFVQIPHSKLIKQINYKAKLEGITIVMQNEAYTSSVSSVDLEPVDKIHSDKRRRIVRGLFKTSYGLMNADINGSLNILRKYVGEKNIPRLIVEVRGLVATKLLLA